MNDEPLKDVIERLDVPAHSDQFWGDLRASLYEATGTQVVRARVSRRGPSPRWMSLAAAVAVLVILGIGGLLLFGSEGSSPVTRQPDGPEPTITTPPTTVPPTSAVESTPALTTAEPATTSAGPIERDPIPAPWNDPPLSADEVPAVLVSEWQKAVNRDWCPALYPTAAGASIEPRAADFSGGWAVAWDLDSGPGAAPDGESCEDCGRSAYGVAGVALPPRDDTGIRMPHVVQFDDGSVAGYAGEGFDASNPKRLAELAVVGHGCTYQIWSHLGDDHLVSLITSLRLIDGLSAGTLELRTGADTQQIDGGPPPWSAAPVPVTEVPEVLARSGNPPLTLVGVEELVPGAASRPVNGYSWGAAWDAPRGPGHDGANEPCEDCGRGVIGLTGFGAELTSGMPQDETRPWLAIVEWSDGSTAYIGWRLADLALPTEAATRPASDTGNPVLDGYQATLLIEGVPGEVIVWSHLGLDHLLAVLENLRMVG